MYLLKNESWIYPKYYVIYPNYQTILINQTLFGYNSNLNHHYQLKIIKSIKLKPYENENN